MYVDLLSNVISLRTKWSGGWVQVRADRAQFSTLALEKDDVVFVEVNSLIMSVCTHADTHTPPPVLRIEPWGLPCTH